MTSSLVSNGGINLALVITMQFTVVITANGENLDSQQSITVDVSSVGKHPGVRVLL